MRAFSYAWSLSVTWQRWRSHHSIRHFLKPHAACKLHGSMFYRTIVIADRSYLHCGNRNFPTCFAPLTFYLDPMTVIYKNPDPHSFEIYRMCENELLTSRLLRVIVWLWHIHMVNFSCETHDPPSDNTHLYLSTVLHGYFRAATAPDCRKHRQTLLHVREINLKTSSTLTINMGTCLLFICYLFAKTGGSFR